MCLFRLAPRALPQIARALSGPHPASRARGTRAADATAGQRRAGDPFLRGCARRTMLVRHCRIVVPCFPRVERSSRGGRVQSQTDRQTTSEGLPCQDRDLNILVINKSLGCLCVKKRAKRTRRRARTDRSV